MKGLLVLAVVVAQVIPLCAEEEAAGPRVERRDKDGKARYALEALIVEPEEMGLEAVRTIEGMVVNVKNPAKIVANNQEQSPLVMSTASRNMNLKFATLGMHSWLNVSYQITDENNKRVTLYLMEFQGPKQARLFWKGSNPLTEADEEGKTDLESKGGLSYAYLHGPVLLKINWTDEKTDGVRKIIEAYKTRLMSF